MKYIAVNHFVSVATELGTRDNEVQFLFQNPFNIMCPFCARMNEIGDYFILFIIYIYFFFAPPSICLWLWIHIITIIIIVVV